MKTQSKDNSSTLLSFATYICGAGHLNTLGPRQNGRHFPDGNFKCILFDKNAYISIDVPLKFVTKSPINNIPALVQMMAWRRPGDKPLSEPMLAQVTDAYMRQSASMSFKPLP